MSEITIGNCTVSVVKTSIVVNTADSNFSWHIRLHRKKYIDKPIRVEKNDSYSHYSTVYFKDTEAARRKIKKECGIDLPAEIFDEMNAKLMMKEMTKEVR